MTYCSLFQFSSPLSKKQMWAKIMLCQKHAGGMTERKRVIMCIEPKPVIKSMPLLFISQELFAQAQKDEAH